MHKPKKSRAICYRCHGLISNGRLVLAHAPLTVWLFQICQKTSLAWQSLGVHFRKQVLSPGDRLQQVWSPWRLDIRLQQGPPPVGCEACDAQALAYSKCHHQWDVKPVTPRHSSYCKCEARDAQALAYSKCHHQWDVCSKERALFKFKILCRRSITKKF